MLYGSLFLSGNVFGCHQMPQSRQKTVFAWKIVIFGCLKAIFDKKVLDEKGLSCYNRRVKCI